MLHNKGVGLRMSNYTTIRIDSVSMGLLEEIAQELQCNNIGRLSKSATLKHIIEQQHNSIFVNSLEDIVKEVKK